MPARDVVLLVIRDTPSRNNAGAGVKLVLTQWIYDDGSSVGFEKYGYYTKDGQLLRGKREILKLEDYRAIKARDAELEALMRCPPTIAREKPVKTVPQEEEIKEVPF